MLTPLANQGTMFDLKTSKIKERHAISAAYTQLQTNSHDEDTEYQPTKGVQFSYYGRFSDPLLLSASYSQIKMEMESSSDTLVGTAEQQNTDMGVFVDYLLEESKRLLFSFTRKQIYSSVKFKFTDEELKITPCDVSHNFFVLSFGGAVELEQGFTLGAILTPKVSSKKTCTMKMKSMSDDSTLAEMSSKDRRGNGDILSFFFGKNLDPQTQFELSFISESNNEDSATAASSGYKIDAERQISKQLIIFGDYGAKNVASQTVDETDTDSYHETSKTIGIALSPSAIAMVRFSYGLLTSGTFDSSGFEMTGRFIF